MRLRYLAIPIAADWLWRVAQRHHIHMPVINVLGYTHDAKALIPWVLFGAASIFVAGTLARWHRSHPLQRGGRYPQSATGLHQLSPGEFEQAVGHILSRIGYHDVHTIGGSGDLGVDVGCIDSDGNRVIAQCKRYAPGHKVGSPEIQLFIGMAYTHHCVAPGCALYFTTATFTQPAIALAKQHNIRLIDGAGLERLLADLSNRRLVAA